VQHNGFGLCDLVMAEQGGWVRGHGKQRSPEWGLSYDEGLVELKDDKEGEASVGTRNHILGEIQALPRGRGGGDTVGGGGK